MAVPWLQLDAVLTKVHDLLRHDARTLGIDWLNGRRILHNAMVLPAGNIYLGPGAIMPETMPAGEVVRVRVVVEVATASHEGGPTAEKLIRGYLDDVAKVLVDNWELGLDYAYPIALAWDPMLQQEATPAFARAACFLDVEVRPL